MPTEEMSEEEIALKLSQRVFKSKSFKSFDSLISFLNDSTMSSLYEGDDDKARAYIHLCELVVSNFDTFRSSFLF